MNEKLKEIYTALMVEYDRRTVNGENAESILEISNKVLDLMGQND